MSDDWTDRLAGARMQVDQQFQPTLDDSDFTNQEWGLVMTAVEFDVEHPDDPDRARLVADTEKLSEIVPALDDIQNEMGGAPRPRDSGSSGGGIFGRVRQYLDKLTSDTPNTADEEQLETATALVEEYTRELQSYLEKRGRWEEIRQAAAQS